MSVVALVNDEDSIDLVLPWASAFARARSTSLTVVCWTHAPVAGTAGSEHGSENLVQRASDFLDKAEITEQPNLIGVSGPSDWKAAIGVARQQEAELLVAIGKHPSATQGAAYSTNPLLKHSPCHVVILFGNSARSIEPRRAFVGATDNLDDVAAIHLASRLAHHCDVRVTLARAELMIDQEGLEVGRRELQHLIREAGVQANLFDCQVFESGDFEDVAKTMDEHDLVLLGANCPLVPTILEFTNKPTVAVVKRAPPLRPWQKAGRSSHWNPRISPADYAELIEGLRHGSRLSADFVSMLSLASIVASIGLLQDSPAVVIGSMLLAPLMTPMIGCGLALAQANEKGGRTALLTVGVGLLCTLAISFVIGMIAPGTELTPQIYARGDPTILDLVVAVASAAAAAYALARPNLVGSIAGVAIATALVPPLCSVGLSLAYADTRNAQGAALLFTTNFVAIVLSAAVTFRLIGITAKYTEFRQRFWVFRVAGILGIAVILVCFPLHQAFLQSLLERKPQPRVFPMAKHVIDALEDRLESHPDATLISAGRPSSQFAGSDVVLVLGTTKGIDRSLADELSETVRQRMQDKSLIVEVHCLKQLWYERTQ